MNEKKRATLHDLAAATGFSLGTIYRALNGKGRIKEETRQFILDTADEIGYKVNVVAQGLRRSRMTIGVVLYCQVVEYVAEIYRGVYDAAQEIDAYNISVDIHLLPYTSNEDCRRQTVELMQTFREEEYDGIILFPSSPSNVLGEIRDMIDKVSESGIPVVTVAVDVPDSKRLFHVSVDAHLVGEMAAELLSLFCREQDVAILNNSMETSTNRSYIEGFYDFAGEDTFRSIRVYSHYDEPEQVLRETERMLAENPELSGIYMASASSGLACECIRKTEISSYRIVMTDLLKETPALLQNGTAFATIFQDPYQQGKTAVMKLYEYMATRHFEPDHRVLPSILLASNAKVHPVGKK